MIGVIKQVGGNGGGVSPHRAEFGILKMLLPLPILSDQYRVGPGDVSLTKAATRRIGTLRMNKARKALTKSKSRFMHPTSGPFSPLPGCFLPSRYNINKSYKQCQIKIAKVKRNIHKKWQSLAFYAH